MGGAGYNPRNRDNPQLTWLGRRVRLGGSTLAKMWVCSAAKTKTAAAGLRYGLLPPERVLLLTVLALGRKAAGGTKGAKASPGAW